MAAKKTKRAKSAKPAKVARGVRIVNTDKAPQAIGPYSQATIANGLLFAAGQIPIDPATGQAITGDVRAQTERVVNNLTAVLAAAGATWKDVLKTTVFLKDLNDFPVVNETYARLIGDARPARATVQVAGLPCGALVEIDAVATVKM